MTYSSLQVANTFIDLAAAESSDIDVMKLLKLVYLAHGWNLAITDAPLINEFVEAWRYGPVIPSIYHEFKSYGNYPITGKGTDFMGDNTPINRDDFDFKLIQKVWNEYKRLTGIQLSNQEHEPDTPWSKTWRYGIPHNTHIPNQLIQSYFEQLAAAHTAK